jgi:hypothetical protein
MPHKTTLPPHYFRVTTSGGGTIWANLDRALTIGTAYTSPTNFVGFTIDFEESEAVIEIRDKDEVMAMAKLLDYTIPGSE